MLLTRGLSVILERLGEVGVIQRSTLVQGGGRPRASGKPSSGRTRANARSSSRDGPRGGGGPSSYMTVISRKPFPLAIDPMRNTLACIASKRSIGFVLPIMLFRGWCWRVRG